MMKEQKSFVEAMQELSEAAHQLRLEFEKSFRIDKFRDWWLRLLGRLEKF